MVGGRSSAVTSRNSVDLCAGPPDERLCGPAIVVRAAVWAPADFSARFDAEWRHYRFDVLNQPTPVPLLAAADLARRRAAGPGGDAPRQRPVDRRARLLLVLPAAEGVTRLRRGLARAAGAVGDAGRRPDHARTDGLLRFEIRGTRSATRWSARLSAPWSTSGRGRRHADDVARSLRAVPATPPGPRRLRTACASGTSATSTPAALAERRGDRRGHVRGPAGQIGCGRVEATLVVAVRRLVGDAGRAADERHGSSWSRTTAARTGKNWVSTQLVSACQSAMPYVPVYDCVRDARGVVAPAGGFGRDERWDQRLASRSSRASAGTGVEQTTRAGAARRRRRWKTTRYCGLDSSAECNQPGLKLPSA